MDYQPKLLHASMTAFIAVALIALTNIAGGNVFNALAVGAAVFLLMTFIIVWMIAYSHRFDTIVRYIEAFIQLDPEQRAALAYNIPALRLVARRGRVVELFEDTQATSEHIRLFLVDSTPEVTSSQHAWNTAEKPRWAWEEIYDWLVRFGKVIPDSAAGSHSYRWRGTAYKSMMLYWIGSSVPDLNAVDGFDQARVFASENHSPTLKTSPSAAFQEPTHSRGGDFGRLSREEA